jgi:hypothetical protein
MIGGPVHALIVRAKLEISDSERLEESRLGFLADSRLLGDLLNGDCFRMHARRFKT